MPLISPPTRPTPDFWTIYGHSWFQFQTGPSGDQTGRVDALFRSAMDIEYNNWRNYALSGARVCANNRENAGWNRVVQTRGLQGRNSPLTTYGTPYAPEGGAAVLCWGINDLGLYGGQTTAVRQTIADTLRAVISRCRASIVHEDNSTKWVWSNWTAQASGNDLSSGGTTRSCAVTTANSGTYTLPTDYQGETVAFAFLLRPGTTGGSVTFGGTAMTGNPDNGAVFYTGGGGQTSTQHAYTVKRISGLTAANAGQTITITCTQLDASSPLVFFDCCWLETKTPPPVLVCDIAKAHTTGTSGSGTGYYNSLYNTWSSGRTVLQMDGDVADTNARIYAVAAEFDGMVQIAYCDAALNPGGVTDPLRTSDGIHPNEYGAGAIVDALVDARNRCTPPATAWGLTLGFNSPSPRSAALRRPRLVNYYHMPDYDQLAYATYTPVALEMYALPLNITEARDTYLRIGIECTAVGTVAGTVRWGIYDDVAQVGYPQQLITGLGTAATSIATTPAAPSVRDSASLNSGFGFVADPGLYWLVVKIETAGTGQTYRGLTGQSTYLPARPTTGIGTALNAGWQLTGIATGAMLGSFPAGAALAATVPLVQVFRSK